MEEEKTTKALVVEDDPSATHLLQHPLESLGYGVLTATNGKDAFDIIRQQRCRLVVSEWTLPEMNGAELCRAIRSQIVDAYVYFVMVSSRGETRDIIDAFSAGIDDYVVKPFEAAEFAARLRTAERILSLETRDMAIFAMAKLAESRDPETGGHLERVREYSRVIASELSLSGPYADVVDTEFVHLMYVTSPLHDIGKVSIPDHVLLKPGRLDDREYEIMKSHAEAGAWTLALALNQYPQAQFLQMASDIALYHHERWDGNGYPMGVAEQDIPLSARVFSVADVYDALSSKRVYKEAYSHDIARSIIGKGSRSQFDPEVVRGFLAAESTVREIRARYAASGRQRDLEPPVRWFSP
ncbi:MAG: response regulator [Planctomycetes bacterium]|nr:response regulator [Planctomycetota bacterium]